MGIAVDSRGRVACGHLRVSLVFSVTELLGRDTEVYAWLMWLDCCVLIGMSEGRTQEGWPWYVVYWGAARVFG